MGLDDRSKRDFRTEIVGPINRIAEFVRSSAIRNMLGQTQNTIDLRQAIDEGHIILANLSGGQRVYEADAELLGRLLTRFLFFHAKRRQRPERPFFSISTNASAISPATSKRCGGGAKIRHRRRLQPSVARPAGAPDDPHAGSRPQRDELQSSVSGEEPKGSRGPRDRGHPLDLETPVAMLTKPTVVGNRRTLFRSTGQASHEAGAREGARAFRKASRQTRRVRRAASQKAHRPAKQIPLRCQPVSPA